MGWRVSSRLTWPVSRFLDETLRPTTFAPEVRLLGAVDTLKTQSLLQSVVDTLAVSGSVNRLKLISSFTERTVTLVLSAWRWGGDFNEVAAKEKQKAVSIADFVLFPQDKATPSALLLSAKPASLPKNPPGLTATTSTVYAYEEHIRATCDQVARLLGLVHAAQLDQMGQTLIGLHRTRWKTQQDLGLYLYNRSVMTVPLMFRLTEITLREWGQEYVTVVRGLDLAAAGRVATTMAEVIGALVDSGLRLPPISLDYRYNGSDTSVFERECILGVQDQLASGGSRNWTGSMKTKVGGAEGSDTAATAAGSPGAGVSCRVTLPPAYGRSRTGCCCCCCCCWPARALESDRTSPSDRDPSNWYTMPGKRRSFSSTSFWLNVRPCICRWALRHVRS